MQHYTVVVAGSLNSRTTRWAMPTTDLDTVRDDVNAARDRHPYVYVVGGKVSRGVEAGPLARTLERRLAASPPADPGLPLALPPLRGPRARRDLDARLVVRLPAELLARLDAARGELDRSAWVRAAIEAHLAR